MFYTLLIISDKSNETLFWYDRTSDSKIKPEKKILYKMFSQSAICEFEINTLEMFKYILLHSICFGSEFYSTNKMCKSVTEERFNAIIIREIR